MSQPEMVLSCAIIAALIGTAAVAALSSLQSLDTKVACMSLFIVVVVLSISAVMSRGLRVNLTPSMPMGIYQIIATDRKAIQRGDLVIACAPHDAAKLGRMRGYLASGVCPIDTEPLLKEVVAVACDVVGASRRGVAVNGKFLANSAPLDGDASGRNLTPWRLQVGRLRQNQVWLYASNPRSWDSRYWGPVSTANILAGVRPALLSPDVHGGEKLGVTASKTTLAASSAHKLTSGLSMQERCPYITYLGPLLPNPEEPHGRHAMVNPSPPKKPLTPMGPWRASDAALVPSQNVRTGVPSSNPISTSESGRPSTA